MKVQNLEVQTPQSGTLPAYFPNLLSNLKILWRHSPAFFPISLPPRTDRQWNVVAMFRHQHEIGPMPLDGILVVVSSTLSTKALGVVIINITAGKQSLADFLLTEEVWGTLYSTEDSFFFSKIFLELKLQSCNPQESWSSLPQLSCNLGWLHQDRVPSCSVLDCWIVTFYLKHSF